MNRRHLAAIATTGITGITVTVAGIIWPTDIVAGTTFAIALIWFSHTIQ